AVIEKKNETLNMFSMALQSAPLVLWAVDLQGVLTIQEGKGLELIGMTPGQDVGKNAFAMFRDRPDVVAPMVRALSGEKTRAITSPDAGVEFDTWYLPLHA